MLFQTEQDVKIIQNLNVKNIPNGTITRYWLKLVTDGMGVPIHVPIIVAKGRQEGKVLSVTAAVHGNENGIPVIQRLFKDIDIEELKGTIVGVPVVNVPAAYATWFFVTFGELHLI